MPRHPSPDLPAHRDVLSKAEIATLVGKRNPLILEIGCNDGTDTLAANRRLAEPVIGASGPEAGSG